MQRLSALLNIIPLFKNIKQRHRQFHISDQHWRQRVAWCGIHFFIFSEQFFVLAPLG